MNEFCRTSKFFKVSIADIEQLIHLTSHKNPNLKVNGKTLLYWAALCGKVKLVEDLLRRGADINLPNDVDVTITGMHAGKRPFYGALFNNQENVIHFLLNAKIKNEIIIDETVEELLRQSKCYGYGYDLRNFKRCIKSLDRPKITVDVDSASTASAIA
jgi:ankyrin repeat protein